MDSTLLAGFIASLQGTIDAYDNDSNGLINAAKALEREARTVLADQPRCNEVCNHLKRGSASSANTVLQEILGAALRGGVSRLTLVS